jgi:g-D-glutamyl-meso-diaminopimelate peptidase
MPIQNGKMEVNMIVKDEQTLSKEIPSYANNREILLSIKEKHSFVKIFPIGRSIMSRNIYAASIGNINNSAMYVGCFNAQEWITTMLLTRFIKDLCDCIDSTQMLADININLQTLEERGVIIIPCINPDGLELVLNGIESAGKYKDNIIMENKDITKWKTNLNGVDLRQNFYSYENKTLECQCETKALMRLCKGIPIRHALIFECGGEQIQWQNEYIQARNSKIMAQILGASSGYSLTTQDIYQTNSFINWFEDHFSRPAYCVKVGKNPSPIPITDFDAIYSKLLEMLLIGFIM